MTTRGSGAAAQDPAGRLAACENAGADSDAPQHTFLFADLVGYTPMTEAHGDALAADVASRFCAYVRDELPSGAETVKTIGDAVMVRFDRPSDAILTGVHVTRAVMAMHEFPALRVGMHRGPAIEQAGDWFGAAVNLAARITAEAAAGQVLLSRSTAEGIAGPPGIRLIDHGPHRLRGVRDEVRLMVAVCEGEEPPTLSIDPVCRMGVVADRAAKELTHRGEPYRFCSSGCAERFARDPEHYLRPDEPRRG